MIKKKPEFSGFSYFHVYIPYKASQIFPLKVAPALAVTSDFTSATLSLLML